MGPDGAWVGATSPASQEVLRIVNVALGLVKSTALYMFLSLLVCIWAFEVGFTEAMDRAADPTNFADWFLLLGFWALPVLLLTIAVSAVGSALRQLFFKRAPYPLYNSVGSAMAASLVGGLGYAFVNPFAGIRMLTRGLGTDLTGIDKRMSQAYVIFHFCWAVALIAYLAVGLFAVSS